MSRAPRTSSRRFWPLVVGTVLLGAGAALGASYATPESSSGTGVYLVPPQAGGVTPYDAERLARTYAVVIAKDTELLADLAGAVGRSVDATSDRTSTVTLPNSAAVRVTYKGANDGEVRSYFAALTATLQSSTPATANIAPGSIRLLSVDPDLAHAGGLSWVAVVTGAVAGLLLGLGGASYLGHSDPRVRRADALREVNGPAAVDVHLREGDSVRALARRVVEDVPLGGRVAIVAADAQLDGRAQALAAALESATGELIEAKVLHDAYSGTTWTPRPLGSGGERAAQEADRTVVVTAAHHRVDHVARAVSDLHDLGVGDVVLAVVHGKPARR